jgi:hypothetical protein
MAGKSDFHVEEWDLLRQAPFMSSMMIAAASPCGPIGWVKEFSATVGVIADAAGSAKTPLVQAVAEDLKHVMSLPKRPEASGASIAQDLALNSLRRASDVVARKASPEEAAEFKAWLTTIAQRTAEAVRKGGFLGFGGELVDEKEQDALVAISSVLGGRAWRKG